MINYAILTDIFPHIILLSLLNQSNLLKEARTSHNKLRRHWRRHICIKSIHDVTKSRLLLFWYKEKSLKMSSKLIFMCIFHSCTCFVVFPIKCRNIENSNFELRMNVCQWHSRFVCELHVLATRKVRTAVELHCHVYSRVIIGSTNHPKQRNFFNW